MIHCLRRRVVTLVGLILFVLVGACPAARSSAPLEAWQPGRSFFDSSLWRGGRWAPAFRQGIAARDRFIAVYPNGTGGRAGRLLTWNAGHCCAAAMDKSVDDVGFIGAIVDTLIASGRADATRVYVTGMSNGGYFTTRLLCEQLEGIFSVDG